MTPDARLTAIAAIDAAANRNSVNFRKATEWMSKDTDIDAFLIGALTVAASLRLMLAEAKGWTVEEVDGLLITLLGAARD